MEFKLHYRNDPERGLLDPILEKGGRRFVFRLYSGDICDPIDGGDWFGPNYPKRVWRTKINKPLLPFIIFKWPFMDRCFYMGFKSYSADGNHYPAYKQWMKPEDCQSGSKALCFSCRPFANFGE